MIYNQMQVDYFVSNLENMGKLNAGFAIETNVSY